MGAAFHTKIGQTCDHLFNSDDKLEKEKSTTIQIKIISTLLQLKNNLFTFLTEDITFQSISLYKLPFLSNTTYLHLIQSITVTKRAAFL